MTNTETAGAGAASDRPMQHDEALQRAGMVAIRMGREGDSQAEERADELTVAHLDGRMRAAQPAGAQQPAPTPQADSQPAAVPDWLPFSKRTQIADRHGVKVTAEFNSLVRDVIQTYLETHALRAARAPADSVLEDAARYRWLRRPHLAAGHGSISVVLDDRANGHMSRTIWLDRLDAVIDAARAAQGEAE